MKPALAAKQLATIDYLTQGRIAINVVSGWFRGEFDAIGEEWPEHDERYVRSEEFIRTLKGIWTTDNYSFDGKYYQFQNYTLKPKPLQNPILKSFKVVVHVPHVTWPLVCLTGILPTVILSKKFKKQVEDIRNKAKANNHQVKIGVNAFIIARDTEEEAKAVLQEIIDKANTEAVNAFGDATREAGAASPEQEGNWAKSTFEDLVQYNDGFKTNLIGTPQQIAERIVALKM